MEEVGLGMQNAAAGGRGERGTTYSWAPGVCTTGGVKDAKLFGVRNPSVNPSPGLCSADDGIVGSGRGSKRASRGGGVGGKRWGPSGGGIGMGGGSSMVVLSSPYISLYTPGSRPVCGENSGEAIGGGDCESCAKQWLYGADALVGGPEATANIS